jgi:hypothetical protein
MIILPHPNWRIDWNSGMKAEVEFKGLKWFLPALIGLVFSCGQPGKPENVLSRDEMVQAFMEIYIIEDKVNRLGLEHDSAEVLMDSLAPRIFKKLSLSDSAFKYSLRYYSDRPQEMELIYTALVDSLQLREQKASGLNTP